MTIPAASKGVIYIAVGERYRAEAAISAASVRATNPGLPLHLLTDAESPAEAVWDQVQRMDAPHPGSAAKLHMDRAPWERCLFLDTDTLVIGSLEPVFTLLERFDFTAVQHSGGHHYQIPGLPSSFPEYNSGVIAWRKNSRVDAFFTRWRELYAQMIEPSGRTWDQKSLRLALYESDLRISSLPHRYNLMPYFPAVVECEAVVLHGRMWKNLRRLQARLSNSTELRAYAPGIGVLHHPRAMNWLEVFRSITRMIAWRIRG